MNGLPSEEIKARLDVRDVISGYITLQKRGAHYRALCPFHNEKSPSFSVSVPRQIWHCFGCGEGGDIFTFVMKMEGIEFTDALRVLAKKAGIVLKAQDPKLVSERAQLHEICAHATRFFESNLESTAGEKAREYLIKRGLKQETIKEFQIGFVTDSWDSLLNFLTMKGYKPDMIEKAGLVLKSNKSGRTKYFDRFRGRIMFPIADIHGDIIAFTGRYLVPKEGEGKYVNSPQTFLYNKSMVLYGIDKTKQEMRKSDVAVLVEGQMDMIMAWQDGVRNVAAVSGTAFTALQLKLIKRHTNNIVILFDADLAGDSATQKSIALAQAGGFSVKVAHIEKGKDPADFVVENPGMLGEKIDKAVSVMDYYFQFAFAKNNKKTLDGKKEIARILLGQIRNIPDKVEVHHFLEKLSMALGTAMEYLEGQMRVMPNQQEQFLPDSSEFDGSNTNIAKPKKREKTMADKLLEHLMALFFSVKVKEDAQDFFSLILEFDFPKFIASGKENDQETIASKNTVEIFALFLKYGKVKQISKDFSAQCSVEGKDILREILLASDSISCDNIKGEIMFCAGRLEKEVISNILAKLVIDLGSAEEKQDAELSERLFKEVQDLSAKKHALSAQQ